MLYQLSYSCTKNVRGASVYATRRTASSARRPLAATAAVPFGGEGSGPEGARARYSLLILSLRPRIALVAFRVSKIRSAFSTTRA